jgi:hypothetical protein
MHFCLTRSLIFGVATLLLCAEHAYPRLYRFAESFNVNFYFSGWYQERPAVIAMRAHYSIAWFRDAHVYCQPGLKGLGVNRGMLPIKRVPLVPKAQAGVNVLRLGCIVAIAYSCLSLLLAGIGKLRGPGRGFPVDGSKPAV